MREVKCWINCKLLLLFEYNCRIIRSLTCSLMMWVALLLDHVRDAVFNLQNKTPTGNWKSDHEAVTLLKLSMKKYWLWISVRSICVRINQLPAISQQIGEARQVNQGGYCSIQLKATLSHTSLVSTPRIVHYLWCAAAYYRLNTGAFQ